MLMFTLNKRKGWRLIFLHDGKTLLLTCLVVRRSVCCVSCCITVGEDWETFQPATGRNLRAYQVKQCCQHQTHKPDLVEFPVTSSVSLFCFYCCCVCCFFIREDLGFRWVSEQVSHHPPVSAFQAEGLKDDFIFHGSIYPKLKFWGKSIEAEPKGVITLELPK